MSRLIFTLLNLNENANYSLKKVRDEINKILLENHPDKHPQSADNQKFLLYTFLRQFMTNNINTDEAFSEYANNNFKGITIDSKLESEIAKDKFIFNAYSTLFPSISKNSQTNSSLPKKSNNSSENFNFGQQFYTSSFSERSSSFRRSPFSNSTPFASTQFNHFSTSSENHDFSLPPDEPHRKNLDEDNLIIQIANDIRNKLDLTAVELGHLKKNFNLILKPIGRVFQVGRSRFISDSIFSLALLYGKEESSRHLIYQLIPILCANKQRILNNQNYFEDFLLKRQNFDDLLVEEKDVRKYQIILNFHAEFNLKFNANRLVSRLFLSGKLDQALNFIQYLQPTTYTETQNSLISELFFYYPNKNFITGETFSENLYIEIISNLIKQCGEIEITHYPSNIQKTVLIEALTKKVPTNIVKLLSCSKIINIPDVAGYTPLYYALEYYNDLSLVDKLLLDGADTAYRLPSGQTIRDYAKNKSTLDSKIKNRLEPIISPAQTTILAIMDYIFNFKKSNIKEYTPFLKSNPDLLLLPLQNIRSLPAEQKDKSLFMHAIIHSTQPHVLSLLISFLQILISNKKLLSPEVVAKISDTNKLIETQLLLTQDPRLLELFAQFITEFNLDFNSIHFVMKSVVSEALWQIKPFIKFLKPIDYHASENTLLGLLISHYPHKYIFEADLRDIIQNIIHQLGRNELLHHSDQIETVLIQSLKKKYPYEIPSSIVKLLCTTENIKIKSSEGKLPLDYALDSEDESLKELFAPEFKRNNNNPGFFAGQNHDFMDDSSNNNFYLDNRL